MSSTRPTLLVSCLCVSTLTACLGGQAKDASTNAGLSGVTVSAQNCDGCPVYTTTTASDGTYKFDAYAGDPMIFQDASVDAVKLVFSKAGYHDMTIFHHVVWHDPIAPSTKMWDFAGLSLFASNIGDGDNDGVYNPIDTSSYKGTSRKAFSGKVLAIVRSTGAPGAIVVSGAASGLTGGSVTVTAQ